MASSMAVRSPNRVISEPDGSAPATWPSPIRPTIRPPTLSDAPSSTALTATTGRMEACPIE
ncbi:hypothetical protein J2S43_004097 [Catenuloplanes nepalensis]|uniref:Uncharacterized protein n=1 Tax=Catenuloplanes nepalensis TaxID=587533 RepID=A0ABT9MW28_9ACTN|nr:hypothetical protein [Catenuloplanes nepalensis]MDP9795585.1 hypothetical protein [Catenuloplanes nepalensis]